MEEFTQFIVAHGYLLLAGWVFLDQLGVPIPAVPILIAGGGLIGSGQLDPAAALAATTLGSMPSDLIWFDVGRRRGGSVLRLLSKLSLGTDSSVWNTERSFGRYGPLSLLIAKFIPGYQMMARPLAGMSGMSVGRFLAWDIPGAVLWSGAFMGLGFAFTNQLEEAYQLASTFGTWLFILVALGLVAYAGWKYFVRIRLLRKL